MTSAELELAQRDLINEIHAFARDNNLTNDNVDPIPDGVYSAERYLAAPCRIMWILKEPYDNFNAEDQPYGGGWNLFDAYDNDNAGSNPTWQVMIYATYGLFNHQRWEDMNYIRDNKAMVEVLKQVACININKMPSRTATIDASLWGKYQLWHNILLKQIATYAPSIIIFGNTFRYFKQDLAGENAEPVARFNGVVDVYQGNGIKLLDTYHPNQCLVSRESYVNSIIEACTAL